MLESSTPPLVSVDESSDLTDFVADWAAEAPNEIAFRRKVPGSATPWVDVTIRQFHDDAVAIAKGLIAAGVQPGERVGLLSRTRYEWTLVDVAIWFAGAVTVPVYETSSPDQVSWILSDSGAKAIVVESDELARHAGLTEQAAKLGIDASSIWTIETGGLDQLMAAGADVSDEEIASRRAGLTLQSPATVIYTSGTTGRPKGCVLTHGNFRVLTANTVKRLEDIVAGQNVCTLLFLPLSHVFARFIQVLAIGARCPMGHTSNVADVVEDLATFRPTYILSVPRIFEKIYNNSEQRALAAGRVRIFHLAASVAVAYSKAMDAGGPGIALRVQHALFDRLVYSKLRAVMGGRLQYAVSGGGPLGDRLGHFFRGCGIIVLEGYGMTESTAPTCVGVPEHIKIGTVGPQLPGNSVAIAEDGEVLLKGPHIFSEYLNNPQATAEAFRDGWLLTGDIGSLDDDGFLRITGRKKEILVTAAGKNVAPAVLEDRLRAHPLISQCIVVGEGKPFIGALVTLDPEMLPIWLKNHGLPEMTVEEAAGNDAVRAAVQHAVDRANEAVSRAESIRRFTILYDDFTIDSGHLTPSLKLKRNVVMRDYGRAVEDLYV